MSNEERDETINVFLVHSVFKSYKNGGYEARMYICKNIKTAENKAKECHKSCIYNTDTTDTTDDIEDSENSNSGSYTQKYCLHSYDECHNQEHKIWIDPSEIHITQDIMMDTCVQI